MMKQNSLQQYHLGIKRAELRILKERLKRAWEVPAYMGIELQAA